MPTTTKERSDTHHLEDQLREQANQLSRMRIRISELVDDLTIVKDDISRFKEGLNKDLSKIVESINRR